MVPVVDESGAAVLTYRSFAGVVGIVSSVLAVIVATSGLAASLFLVAERHAATAAIAISLAVVFSYLILMLVPRINVTMFHEDEPVLTISQRSWSSFPAATFSVVTADGHPIATLSTPFVSRLGRNRWKVTDPKGRFIGAAAEESFARAVLRKLLGKFSRRFETDVRIDAGGKRAGAIIRRPHIRGDVDVLDCTSDIDRRIAVALAVLILGAEP